MGILDFFKKGVADMVTTANVTLPDMAWSLGAAFLMGLFVLFIYRRTYRGVLFSHGFAFSLVLLAMVTALVIRTISSNLALSLGMVGALSIVRFRTAIKDPIDTVFMFWSIVCGIMAGAGLILIGLVASVGVGALYAIISMFLHKTKSPYLLVVRYEPDKAANIGKALNYLPRYRIKSRTVTRGMAEVTVEVSLKESEMATVDKFLSIPGVLDASIVSYEGEFGL